MESTKFWIPGSDQDAKAPRHSQMRRGKVRKCNFQTVLRNMEQKGIFKFFKEMGERH